MTDTSLPPVAVTGSTGYLGGLVARLLAEESVDVRLLARHPERAPQLPGAVAIRSFYADDEQTRSSLVGVRTLLMVSAAESADRLQQHRALIDAATAAGVKHIVYTSFFGAAADAVFTLARDHWATEQHMKASGMAWTFLRDNFYLDVLPFFAGEDGVIRGPAGDGAVAAVARDDVARVAATVLRRPESHTDVTYELTGPEALTMAEVAAVVTEQTGRATRFHDESIPEAYASRQRWPAPQWQYDAWVSTYTAIAAGQLARTTDHVQAISGRRPLTLAQLLQAGAAGSTE